MTAAELRLHGRCRRRPWLDRRHPTPGTPDPAAALRQEGMREVVRRRYAPDECKEVAGASATITARGLLGAPTARAVLGGSFEHDGLRVRVPLLERATDPPGTWILRPIRSGVLGTPSGGKSALLSWAREASVQLFVLEGCGVPISRIAALHPRKDYVHGAGARVLPPPSAFLAERDITAQTRAMLPDVAAQLSALRRDLASAQPPAAEPGPRCREAPACPHVATCSASKPRDWVGRLPHIRQRQVEDLMAAGRARMPDLLEADLPRADARRELWARVGQAHAEGGLVVADCAASLLALLGPPAGCLDFEFIQPTVPRIRGTRPHERIVFQFSLHFTDGAGARRHKGFLADERAGDPRRAFLDALIDALSSPELAGVPVLTWTDSEAQTLAALAAALPDRAADIEAIRARLRDLCDVVRRSVYHPRFGGSFSLKRVAPALAPRVSYSALDVADGSQAAAEFELLLVGGRRIPPKERAERRAALERYCELDTLAMVEVHAALLALTAGWRKGRTR